MTDGVFSADSDNSLQDLLRARHGVVTGDRVKHKADNTPPPRGSPSGGGRHWGHHDEGDRVALGCYGGEGTGDPGALVWSAGWQTGRSQKAREEVPTVPGPVAEGSKQASTVDREGHGRGTASAAELRRTPQGA